MNIATRVDATTAIDVCGSATQVDATRDLFLYGGSRN